MKNEVNSSFAGGVAILTLSTVIVKLIGVCYKIPLVRLLGSEGMGYFNAAYDVYAILCIVSTTGLPVAISVIMNKYREQHKRIFLLSLCIVIVIGLISALGVFAFSEQIAVRIGARSAAMSLRFMAPAVLFICITGALRGYYQGMHNMLPTAVSQVIEAVGKLVFGLVFAYIAISKHQTLSESAAFAVLGLSMGTFLCMVFLLLYGKREKFQQTSDNVDWHVLLKQLISVAFPVTLGAVLSGMSKIIDLGLIMRRLEDAGIESEMAVSLYGCYSAMVIPLYNAIPAMFGSLAMPLIPHLAGAYERRDMQAQKDLLNTSFRLTALIGIPGAIGLGMLSDQVLPLLFGRTQDLDDAIPMLIVISMAIPASCLITATSAILQAYGHAWLPMVSTAAGCAIKALTLYLLCANPSIGIMAAPISTLICCIVIVTANLFFVCRVAPPFSFCNTWICTIGISVLSIGTASALKRALISVTDLIIIRVSATVATAVLFYGILAYLFGLFRISDIKNTKKE